VFELYHGVNKCYINLDILQNLYLKNISVKQD
jgi:hypothetical protein